jgi:hypothetical protein
MPVKCNHLDGIQSDGVVVASTLNLPRSSLAFSLDDPIVQRRHEC